MNGSEWKKPQPEFIKKKIRFPSILFFLSIFVIYFLGIAVSWVLFGKIIPLNVILVIWIFIDLFIAIALLCILLVILRYIDRKINI